MLRVIKLLLFGHWCVYDEPFREYDFYSDGEQAGQSYDCRCKKCGRIKRFRPW